MSNVDKFRCRLTIFNTLSADSCLSAYLITKAHNYAAFGFLHLPQSWTWIESIHGLDWIGLDWVGLDQDFEETLWIGLDWVR